MTGQSNIGSFVEAWANVVVGFLVALVGQEIIFPWYGIHISNSANFQILVLFTFISLIRSYALRRAFNWATLR